AVRRRDREFPNDRRFAAPLLLVPSGAGLDRAEYSRRTARRARLPASEEHTESVAGSAFGAVLRDFGKHRAKKESLAAAQSLGPIGHDHAVAAASAGDRCALLGKRTDHR